MMVGISGGWQDKVRLKREAQAKALAAATAATAAAADVCVKTAVFLLPLVVC